MSNISRISNLGKDFVDEAMQKATEPRVVQAAERIKEQAKRPIDAIPMMIAEAEEIAA